MTRSIARRLESFSRRMRSGLPFRASATAWLLKGGTGFPNRPLGVGTMPTLRKIRCRCGAKCSVCRQSNSTSEQKPLLTVETGPDSRGRKRDKMVSRGGDWEREVDVEDLLMCSPEVM